MINFAKMREHRLCYLATPYTKYRHGIHVACVEACQFAAGLIREGVKVYSPIAHGHSIAMYGNLDPLQHAFWVNIDAPMLGFADALIVAELPGWLESEGVQHEIALFDSIKKPVYYLSGDCFA